MGTELDFDIEIINCMISILDGRRLKIPKVELSNMNFVPACRPLNATRRNL